MAKRPEKKVGRVRKAAKKLTHRVRAIVAPKEEAERQVQIARDEQKPSDFEEFLLNSLATDKTGGIYKSIAALDMIFSLTRSGKELGYKSGFLVGHSICQRSDGNIDMLFKSLEMYGLGQVLYYPSPERVIITANEQRRGRVGLGENIHIYEAGLIAGFLSASTGQKITVREAQCIFNNGSFCQFVADQDLVEEYKESYLKQDEVIRTIAQVIDSQPSGLVDSHTEHEYYLLPLLPLMKKPLSDETGKLLYLIGVQLAKISKNEDPQEMLDKIAFYFDLGSVSVEKSGSGKRVIRLKYKHYNSLDNLVRLSSSLFIGFLTTALNSRPEIEMFNDADNLYVVKMRIKWDK